MSKLDRDRVDLFYEKLSGRQAVRSGWSIERRNLAQKIVYIEQACRAVLEIIAELETVTLETDIRDLEKRLKSEFRFLGTLRG